MSIAEDRWGLERTSVRQVNFDKSYRRKRVVRQVVEVQTMARELGLDRKSDYVRRAAEAITRPSKLFARVLAQAQEDALNS